VSSPDFDNAAHGFPPDPPGLPGLGSLLHNLAADVTDEEVVLYRAWREAGRPGKDHPTTIALEESYRSKSNG
jgi:hypothetical protein